MLVSKPITIGREKKFYADLGSVSIYGKELRFCGLKGRGIDWTQRDLHCSYALPRIAGNLLTSSKSRYQLNHNHFVQDLVSFLAKVSMLIFNFPKLYTFQNFILLYVCTTLYFSYVIGLIPVGCSTLWCCAHFPFGFLIVQELDHRQFVLYAIFCSLRLTEAIRRGYIASTTKIHCSSDKELLYQQREANKLTAQVVIFIHKFEILIKDLVMHCLTLHCPFQITCKMIGTEMMEQ